LYENVAITVRHSSKREDIHQHSCSDIAMFIELSMTMKL